MIMCDIAVWRFLRKSKIRLIPNGLLRIAPEALKPMRIVLGLLRS
jgi:hypothetical protein